MNAREELARLLHNVYEIQAKIIGWKTQDSCQVEFDKLPEANKRVMLTVAQAVIDAGFVRFSDVEIDKERVQEIVDKYAVDFPWSKYREKLATDVVEANPIRVKEVIKNKGGEGWEVGV